MKFLRLLLLLITSVVLAAPALQHWKPMVKEKDLNGIYRTAKPPDLKSFSWGSWFRGSFQEKIVPEMNDHIGFRKTLIRIRNQADWSLFKTSNTEGFIAGKDGFLYEEDYIFEYTGTYFIGERALDLKARRLKAVQEALGTRGICLLPVIEPGKASFYPEHIPARYHPECRSMSNLEYLQQRMDRYGVRYLDLNRWFLLAKDTSRYKLFPEYGMHWSIYGATLAMDTLTKYLNGACGFSLPGFTVDKIVISDSLQGTDGDIEVMLNLLCPLPPVTAAYPTVRFDKGGTTSAPRVLGVGDSYFNTIYNLFAPHQFRSTEFWYYNSRYYSYDSLNNKPVDHSDLPGKLARFNLILLTFSEINAHCGFWNFVDQAWVAFCGTGPDSEVYGYENRIRNEREWFRSMVQKADAGGLSLESAIHRDAVYMVESDRSLRQKD